MTIRRVYAVMLAACVPAAGCGTIANVVTCDGDAKVPFGGVRHDLAFIQAGTAADGGPKGGHGTGTATMLLCAADLPFSLIGDVLTWPYTKAYTEINQPALYLPSTVAPPAQTIVVPPTPPMPMPAVKAAPQPPVPVPMTPSEAIPIPADPIPVKAALQQPPASR